MRTFILSAAALAALTGCDMATEMAGDAIKSEVRTRYIEQCTTIAENTGIAAERISAACECSADDFSADLAADGQLELDRARIAAVLKTCVQDSGSAAAAEE